jgi:hypothetical protein
LQTTWQRLVNTPTQRQSSLFVLCSTGNDVVTTPLIAMLNSSQLGTFNQRSCLLSSKEKKPLFNLDVV